VVKSEIGEGKFESKSRDVIEKERIEFYPKTPLVVPFER